MIASRSAALVTIDGLGTPCTTVPQLGATPKRIEPIALVDPPVLPTVTSVTPSGRAGVTALRVVDETKVTLEAGTPPKDTVDAAVKPVPEIVTVVPPATGLKLGEIEATVGAAM